jgi:hypothetical protein
MIEFPPRVLIEIGRSTLDPNGVGVFAVADIAEGMKVADGIRKEDYQDLIPWARLDGYDADVRRKIRDFCIGTPVGFIPPEDLDFNKLSVEWYLNHSCEGNCGFNDAGDFVAIMKIKKGEELAYDYGLAESNPNFIMECTCGRPACRKTITGNDWKDEGFRRRNLDHMLPDLRQK